MAIVGVQPAMHAVSAGVRAVMVLATVGVALGVGGRIIMAVIAAVEGIGPRISLGGSLEVVLMGMIIGVIAGVPILALRRWVPAWNYGRAAMAGAVVFLVLALVPPPSARSALTGISPDMRWISAVFFAILFIVWALALEFTANQLMKPIGAAYRGAIG